MAGERKQVVFDRSSPAKENQEEQNTDTGGQKSQQDEFQGTVSLPADNSPVQILLVFGAWLSTTVPMSGNSRHALLASPKITDYEDPLLTMPFPRRLFQVPTNFLNIPLSAQREFYSSLTHSGRRDRSPEKRTAASSLTGISPVLDLDNRTK
jgi:hypothetical protein